MADWNNETDSIVIRKCVNENSDLSGVNGTKQGNNGKATSTTTFRIGLGGEGGSEVKVKAEAPIIAMRAL